MTTTIRYFAPLVWQGTSSSAQVRQAAPVVWTTQNINAYFRQMQAVQWFSSPTPVTLRKVTALQWSQDNPTMSIRRVMALQWTQDAIGAKFRAMPAVTWTKLSSSGSLRQVSAFAMQKSSTQGQLRQVSAFVMQKKQFQIKTGGLAGLWALIQADAKQTISQSQLSVSAPVADSSQINCNTYVTVAPIGTLLQQYSGTYKLYYNRTDIANAFLGGTNNTWKLGTISSATTIRALIPQINTQYGLTLDPTDVVDGPVAANATKLQLVVDPNSYVFAPGTNVYLMNSVVLSTAVTTVNLPGFANASGVGPAANTKLLMHFDNAGTSAYADVLGHTVTNNGAAVAGAGGKFGAGYFPSGAGYLAVSDAPDLHFTGDLTIEFWAWHNNVTQNGMILSKGTSAQSGYQYIQSTSGLVRILGTDGSVIVGTPDTSSTKVGTWQHFAFVRAGNSWKCFVDGVLVQTVTSTQTFGNNTYPLWIGQFLNGSTAMLFNGRIDELRLSNMARYTTTFIPPAAPFVVD
jgi:hypothetical protein